MFSVEPGFYRPGRFGLRFENLVVLEEDGARPLNASSRHHAFQRRSSSRARLTAARASGRASRRTTSARSASRPCASRATAVRARTNVGS